MSANDQTAVIAVLVDIEIKGQSFRLGELSCSGNAVSFSYNDEWLHSPHYFALEEGLDGPGRFFAPRGKVFRAFSDSAPDRWGRSLLDWSSRMGELSAESARLHKIIKNKELLYILSVSDALRNGALRFRIEGGKYLTGLAEGVPKLVNISELLTGAQNFIDRSGSDEAIKNLVAPGSSLGGARPKSGVEEHGKLMIAKFSKRGDEINAPAWENVNLSIAADAGMDVPHHRLLAITTPEGKADVLLISRFDRDSDNSRIHFASALTLLNADDMEKRGYLEIGQFIESKSADPKKDLNELWMRAMLNVLISNTDDHLRNHGFLRAKGSWRLSPVYDLESALPASMGEKLWAMGLEDGGDRDLSAKRLTAAAPLFSLNDAEIREKLEKLSAAVPRFRWYAAKAGIKQSEINAMAPVYETPDLEFVKKFLNDRTQP